MKKLFILLFDQLKTYPKTYVNESVNQQSGLVGYIPTTNFQNETKYIIFPIFC